MDLSNLQFNYYEAKDLIKERLGIDVEGCGFRNVYNNEINIFKSDLDRNTDFYVIGTSYISSLNKKELYQERITIFYLSEEIVANYEEKAVRVTGQGDSTRYVFNLDDHFECIYDAPIHEEASEPSKPKMMAPFDTYKELEGDRMTANQMTARDYACMFLKVPESSKEWLNDLIRKSKK